MSVRTVRLDEETEKTLAYIVHTTGLPISGVLKQGLLVLRTQLAQQTSLAPYDIYAALDLGPGGYTIAPSTETRRGVQEAIKRKLGGDFSGHRPTGGASLLWGGHHCMNREL